MDLGPVLLSLSSSRLSDISPQVRLATSLDRAPVWIKSRIAATIYVSSHSSRRRCNRFNSTAFKKRCSGSLAYRGTPRAGLEPSLRRPSLSAYCMTPLNRATSRLKAPGRFDISSRQRKTSCLRMAATCMVPNAGTSTLWMLWTFVFSVDGFHANGRSSKYCSTSSEKVATLAAIFDRFGRVGRPRKATSLSRLRALSLASSAETRFTSPIVQLRATPRSTYLRNQLLRPVM